MPESELDEMIFLVELLNKYPTDSIRKIAQSEGIDYYYLKRLYDKYRDHISVYAIYNIKRLGLHSYLVFLSVPREKLRETAEVLKASPFVLHVSAMFGFKNGIHMIMHVPTEQQDLIGEYLSRFSDDFEYYEVRAYPPSGDDNFGEWDLSYSYAVLMDILKWDARTPISEISKKLGKSRPTVKYMIDRLKKEDILLGYGAALDNDMADRSVGGISSTLNEDVFERFKEYEIQVGVLRGAGYYLEWYFSSNEDLAEKIFEFGKYAEKVAIMYLDMLRDIEEKYKLWRFSGMIKKDGSGYRSILDF